MYMHITFHDGSNPYVTFNKSAGQIKQIYKNYNKAFRGLLPLNARIDVFSSAVDNLRIRQNGAGYFAVFHKTDKGFEQQISNWYFYFGCAVNALSKASAKLQEATT